MFQRLRCGLGDGGLLLAGAVFALALPALALAGGAQLQRVTLHAAGSEATLRLELSGSVAARSFTLDSPRRLVIDLPATRRPAKMLLPEARSPLQSLRLGTQKDGSLRVVIGLEGSTRASVQPSHGGGGTVLIVSLRGSTSPDRANATNRLPASPSSVPMPVPVPVPAASAAPVAAAHAPPLAGRDIVVAVDAGHGGEDPGASGRAGTQEKTITLAIARRLVERIGREAGVRAVLTRESDRFVPLRDRAARARTAGADLFVSVHADAVRDRDIEGASVYVLSERGASSEAARILADRENAADLRGVPLSGRPPALASVLVDLSQSAALGSSVEAAGNVLDALDHVGAIRKREVQYAGFAVLKSPDMPSMLVETAYISNPTEEAKLRDAGYQTRLADAIAGGVLKYFHAHPPDGTRMAQERRRTDGSPLRLAQSH